MPKEQKQIAVMYVEDGFGNKSWHYAASDKSAIEAHKFHFFGADGLSKQYREAPRVLVATTVIGNVVCVEAGCCNYAGVPSNMATNMNRERFTHERA